MREKAPRFKKLTVNERTENEMTATDLIEPVELPSEGAQQVAVGTGEHSLARDNGSGSRFAGGELFSPPLPFQNGHLQTALALVKPDADDAYHIDQPLVVDAGPDLCDTAVTAQQQRRVQLMAYYTSRRQPDAPAPADLLTAGRNNGAAGTHRANAHHQPLYSSDKQRGLVLMLHGWLGCSHSNYNRATTAALTHAGYDVVRLNLRDHGPDYHVQSAAMNPGIFLGILIEEAHCAAQQLALLAGDRPFFIVGVSMGGNFALRMAQRHATDPIVNLRKVIAINPAVNPASATDNVDRFPFYRRFFRRRWLMSLLTKQALHPELYDFAELRHYPTIRGMTERLIARYGERFGTFRTADEYFAQYAVAPATLGDLTVSTTIITAQDDPIIDAREFQDLPVNSRLTLQLHPTGGHVGYVSLFPKTHYLPQAVLRALNSDS